MTKALAAVHHTSLGGVFYSDNIDFTNLGTQPTWTKYSNTGLANLLIKRAQFDQFDPYNKVYLQLDDDTCYCWNGSSWTQIMTLAAARTLAGTPSGYMGFIFVDKVTAGTVYIPMSQDTVAVALLKSVDYGANWTVGSSFGGLVTAVAYGQACGQYMAISAGEVYRKIYFSTNGGASWVKNSIWVNTFGGGSIKLDPHNPTHVYYRQAAADDDLTDYTSGSSTVKQDGYHLAEVNHESQHWIDKNTAGHHKIVRNYSNEVHIFATTDDWATFVDSTPTALDVGTTEYGAIACAIENVDYTLIGRRLNTGGGVQIVQACVGDNPTGMTGVSGTNYNTSPYTSAIPGVATCYIADSGLYVGIGAGAAENGVFVYADEEGDITDIPSYPNLGTPMFGDRASFRDLDADNDGLAVPTALSKYHAQDIRADTPQRHAPWSVPAPAAGYGIVSDGSKWVVSSDEIVLAGDIEPDINSRYLGVYNYINAGSSTYRIGLAASDNLRDWKTITEPIIDVGAGGAFDDVHCRCPRIVTVDGILYVYYDAYSGTAWSIGLARSFDGGTTWVKYGQVLAASVAWESGNVDRPLVYYDIDEANAAKRWKMWYTTEAGAGGTGIGYAYSADGLAWTKYASNPVLDIGGGGSWNDTYLDTGAIIKRGSTYLLFYDGKSGAAWKGGYCTFTDPEGTYTQSADNPILEGDTLNTAVTVNVGVGDTQITVADATIFEIGAPVWVRDASNWYLTRVVHQISGTVLEVEDAAPDAIAAATGYVTSVASGSTDFMCVLYDDGYIFFVNTHQPIGGTVILRELNMIGYSDDLTSVSLDYGSGITIHPTLAESREASVSHENLSVVDTWEMLSWHEPPDIIHAAVTLDADADTKLSVSAGQQITYDTQAANTFLAGPTSGAAAKPNHRAIVLADLAGIDLGSIILPYIHEHAINEDLSGLCDGSRTVFILANEYKPETTAIYLNGVRQLLVTDYTEDAGYDQITLTTAPEAGDILTADYVLAGAI